MSEPENVRTALAPLLWATRGALEWMIECGESEIALDEPLNWAALTGENLAETKPISSAVQSFAAIAAQNQRPSQQPQAQVQTQPQEQVQQSQTQAQTQPQAQVQQAQAKPKQPFIPPPNFVKPPATTRPPLSRPPEPAPVLPAPPVPFLVDSTAAGEKAKALWMLREELGDCARCPLCKSRTELVFGQGNPAARVVFVAEAPSEKDTLVGVPFVDKAGELLSQMIRAMGLHRQDVYITFLAKCYPGQGGVSYECASTCLQYLRRELEIIEPEVIVAFDEHSAQLLTGEQKSLPLMRGRWLQAGKLSLRATFHPVSITLNPSLKRDVWNDLKSGMRKLGLKQN